MKLALLAIIIVLTTLNFVTSQENVDAAWIDFKQSYREYKSFYDENLRKSIFVENFNKIAEHNKLYQQGLVNYSLTINEFADLSIEEFKNTYTGYKKGDNVEHLEIVQFILDANVKIPEEFNWIEKGAVTSIKSQGKCGSCWSFATTGALEGQYFLKTGKLVSLSEQNLLDCNTENNGCHGGDYTFAFAYVHDNDGIDSEEAYPYKNLPGRCLYKPEKNVTSTKGYGVIETSNEEHLKAAVATIGPIAIAMDFNHHDLMFYKRGVYYSDKCRDGTKNTDDLNHAVLAVGYGTEHGEDYWLLKNSWGSNWGDKGYFKIARNKDNLCGIATYARYPINY